ncbi:hypothetical protein NSK_008327 [Nannochloropsis salina CCMP1776]|uniref:Ubiquinol-cytochrome C reductase hinge domain-containing protein n=1 Tax=Nannochloropsis salina CCMP1776 TaxID=1027361 RepID=A0A4D9CMH4_9STRA|nr:hypothetical protein NSK_008327 [Nannochloropsis salina CCMP1776]|eukprot:TFJ80322.1 hypothetical protein NSK_008327 [Nannochloropsis salina CCMP1776]
MADEEPVDTMPEIREAVKPKCAADWKDYQGCVYRIQSRGDGTCEPQYMEWLKCIDKHSAKQILKVLK